MIKKSETISGGIYAILNTKSDRIYIGQTKNFLKRWKKHKYLLSKNKHRNQFLQNDFNKCKIKFKTDEFLTFIIIEQIDINDKNLITMREQIYLDAFIPTGECYNIQKIAQINDPSCFSKTPKETSEKISKASKRNWANPEYREKISKFQKELWKDQSHQSKISEASKRNWTNPEYREKISKFQKKLWENVEYKKEMSNTVKKRWENSEYREKASKSQKELWKDQDYQSKMSNGKKELWKNPTYREKILKKRKEIWDSDAHKKKMIEKWQNPEYVKKKSETQKKRWENPEYKKKVFETWDKKLSKLKGVVLSPEGIEYEIFNIKRFSIEHGLNRRHLSELINKKAKSHKGWKLK
jgi:group I intron endonuclease